MQLGEFLDKQARPHFVANFLLNPQLPIHQQTSFPIMSPLLPNISTFLSTPQLVVILTIVSLVPSSATAMPISPREPTPPSEPLSPNHSHMSPKIIFGIVFGLGLLFLAIGSLACLASWKPLAWPSGVIDRMSAASDSLERKLSPFRLTTFLTRAGDVIANANDASV